MMPDSDRPADLDISEESQAIVESFAIVDFSRYANALTSLGSSSNEDGLITAISDVLYGEIRVDGCVVSDLHPALDNVVYFPADDLTGQTKVRYGY